MNYCGPFKINVNKLIVCGCSKHVNSVLGQSHDRSTFSIIREIKMEKVQWVKHVAYIKERNTYRTVVGRDQLEDLGLSRWRTLKCLLQNNRMAEHGLDELGSG